MQGPDDTNGEMTPEWVDFNPPPPTGCFINNVALGNKEVLWSFRRRMKPGGLRGGAHSGLHPLRHADATESHSLGFRPRERLSIRGRGCPLPCQTCCGVVCVLRQGEPPETLHRSTLRQQRRAVPTAAHDTPMGTALWAQYLPGRYHHSRAANTGHLGPQPTAGYQGGLQGKIHPKPFLLLHLADSRRAAYITPGPRGKCQKRIELGGSMLAHSANRSISGGWNKGGGNWNMGGSGHAEKDQGHFGWRDWHCKGKETVN